MLKRSEFPLKLLCWVLMAVVAYRLVLVLVHFNPLYHLKIPALPSLPGSVAASTGNTSTNSSGAGKAGTNITRAGTLTTSTNAAVRATNAVVSATNRLDTPTQSTLAATNAVSPGTNLLARGTNATTPLTNSFTRGSNAAPTLAGGGVGPRPPHAMPVGPGMPGGPMPGMGMGMGKPGPELSPEMQARVDRVIDSEILAPVMRPLPLALLGIAGESVFLRAPNGQTGLIKEGEELGGVKLLRIGTNRVLVEEQGAQQELTIFAGLGGDSLLSTQKPSSK